MAHGKETPRQKMIGMMYLVLTALLALNVSRDILEAFVVVDKGLTKTTKNFTEKNKMVYMDFDKSAITNEAKTKKWKDYALEIKKHADQLTCQNSGSENSNELKKLRAKKLKQLKEMR